MDLEETVAALLSKNEQFRQENVQLKAVLSVVQENRELRARMRSFSNDTLEDMPGIVLCRCMLDHGSRFAVQSSQGCGKELKENN